MKKIRIPVLILPVLLVNLVACNLEINKTIRIEDGSVENSSLNSVNGGIIIGKNCEINGDARAVNGQIEVGENSRVRDLQSVNGSITIARSVTVDGDVSAVNGSISCEPGVTVTDDINTINGGIELFQTYVHRDVSTRNGNITVRDSSRIGGDIIIAESDGQSKKHRHIDITIADNSVVEGGVIVKDEHVKVRVYLSSGGAISGKIVNAEVIEE
jgi:DUF4097 and DUF4098 domain-containing protein YvlB